MRAILLNFVVSGFIFLSVTGTCLYGQAACGNDSNTSRPPCSGDGDGSNSSGCPTQTPSSCGGDNIINAYTGNAHRSSLDLQVWGGIGKSPLQWIRFHDTRTPAATNNNPFGNAGFWNPSYSYSITTGANVVVVNPVTGLNQTVATLNVSLVDNESYTFTQQATNANLYLPADNVGMTLTNNSGTFVLQLGSGYRYFFTQITSPAVSYVWTSKEDPQGIIQTATYDSNGNLIKVSDPTGRYLSITYTKLVLTPTHDKYNVISTVTTSDGRQVNYGYTLLPDSTRNDPWVELTSATFGDGTQALYTYYQDTPGDKPLLSQAVDPRQRENSVNIVYTYYPRNGANGGTRPYGYVESEGDGATGETIASVASVDNHTPYILYPNGRQVTFSIVNPQAGSDGGNGNVKKITNGLGYISSYVYTDGNSGFLSSKTDANGNTTTYTRDSYGNPLTTTYPDGTVDAFTYDSLEQPLTETVSGPGFATRTTTWTRDSNHRVTQITYPDSSYETFTYNSFNEVLAHRLRSGGTESNTYDSTGLKQTAVDALGKTTTYTYNSYGLVATATDPRGNVTNYQYTERGLTNLVTYADGSHRSFAYDDFGNLISTTNEIGNTWNYTFDTFRRLTSNTDPLGRTTLVYYGAGTGGATGCGACNNTVNPTRIVLPSGKETDYSYDLEWHKLSVTVGTGTSDAAITSYAYDPNGNQTQTTDPRGNTTNVTFDSRNRKITSTDPMGYEKHYGYDGANDLLTITRPDGGVTTNVCDSIGRVLQTTDPKGQVVYNTYDASGNLLTTIDPNGNTYGFAYDLLNRKLSMTYPDSSIENYSYDAVGNLATFTTRAGQVQSFAYDNRNRETAYTWSDSTPGVTHTYDAAGRLLTSANSNSISTYTYDNANEMLSETEANTIASSSWVLNYTYNSDGNEASLTYPSGIVVTYGYTNRNQVSSVAVAGTTVGSYAYDLDGNVLTKTLGDGTLASYTYDTNDRLTTLNNTLSGTSFNRFDYGFDNLNRRTYEQRNSAAGDVYSYDQISQVTNVAYDATAPATSSSGADRTVAYSLDGDGNRTSVNDSTLGGATSYTPNSLNQYATVGGVSYGYDGNGNLTSGNGTFTYDAQNRLVTATVGSNSDQYSYDPKNRVVERQLNGTPTFYIYDGWNLIEERDNAGDVLATYVDGVRQDELISRATSAGTIYYHQNALGSIVALTNTSGTIVENYKYDIYGNASITSGSGSPLTTSAYGNRFMFTGREYLPEVNLYDYRNRVYSAILGRFLQTDPMRFNAGDVNIYRYVSNNPVNHVDPSGLNGPYIPPPNPSPIPLPQPFPSPQPYPPQPSPYPPDPAPPLPPSPEPPPNQDPPTLIPFPPICF